MLLQPLHDLRKFHEMEAFTRMESPLVSSRGRALKSASFVSKWRQMREGFLAAAPRPSPGKALRPGRGRRSLRRPRGSPRCSGEAFHFRPARPYRPGWRPCGQGAGKHIQRGGHGDGIGVVAVVQDLPFLRVNQVVAAADGQEVFDALPDLVRGQPQERPTAVPARAL